MNERSEHPAVRANPTRPLIMGRRGAVAAAHPLATQAGLDVLRAGGHAADAATAMAFVLGVVEPFMSGLGGDGFYHVLDGRTGRSTVFNGSGAAPLAATVERVLRDGPRITPDSALSLSTPGALAGIAAMHAAFGRRPWEDLIVPAIDLARSGFAATHTFRLYTGLVRARILSRPRTASVFLVQGERPPLGAMVVQRDLAATLALIARDGADTFYRGPLARRIVEGIAAAGGILSADDLAACEAERQTAIGVDYRGFEVRQTPPNSMGFAMLQALKILERFDVVGASIADLVHLTVEARKRAFLDRDRHAGDPRVVDVPIGSLLGAAAIDAHAAAIDPNAAAARAGALVEESDTTYFCAVDREGNAVSAIQSLSAAYGCAVTAGDTGVVMNSRMTHWHLDEGHPNRLAPGKRVRQTLSAPLVLRGGQLVCVLGAPGADNQVLIQLQTLVEMIDRGVDPQRAAEAPRWIVSRARQPGAPEGLEIERTIGATVVEDLRRRGHQVRVLSERGASGGLSVILRRPGSGLLMAASDPRRDGWAAAW